MPVGQRLEASQLQIAASRSSAGHLVIGNLDPATLAQLAPLLKEAGVNVASEQ
jgi:hypothetical protein